MSGSTSYNLSIAAGQALVAIARHSLESFVREAQMFQPQLDSLPPELSLPGTSFITLAHGAELRGCIGTVYARRALAEDVAANAAAAASRDPRFPPVSADELAAIRLEVTILSIPERLHYENFRVLQQKLRPGVDGVLLSWKDRRALLLPQMWSRLPRPVAFLEALAHKAMIPLEELRRYPPAVDVHIFQVQTFKEDGYREPAG